MINSLTGIGLKPLLDNIKPTFVWDAYRAGRSIGAGLEGNGHLGIELVDDDSITATEPFCVWIPGQNKFKQVTPAANPEEVLGPCGEFYEGYLQQRFPSAWDAANLGFAVVTPTDSGALYQDTGNKPDILDSAITHGDTTIIDTTLDAVNDAFIEQSAVLSSSYKRVFQVLVKSEDDTSPVNKIKLGVNTTAETRTIHTTWWQELPGGSGWWVVSCIEPAGSGTCYLSISAEADTGKWYVAAPLWFSVWSAMENVPRSPIPVASGPTTYRRGLWWAETANAEIKLKPTGWLAMSIVLPERSVEINNHKDYNGDSNYKFLGLLNLLCDSYRIRVNMSDSLDYLTVSLGTEAESFAFLDFANPDTNWNPFDGFGIVVTWEIVNGNKTASLYINGDKIDSVYNPEDWYPNDLSAAKMYIGISQDSGTAADCWISRVAYGTSFIHRSYARTLSKHMYNLARGKNTSSVPFFGHNPEM